MCFMKKVFQACSGFVFALALLIPAFAQSQSTTGLIQGTVIDPNGAVVQGATISVKNSGTGFERSTTSNSDGFFSIPLLPLGKYRVSTEAKSFSKSVIDGLEVNVGQSVSLKIEMKVGGSTETVNITAEGEGVEVSRTELNTLINERSVEGLPINRRDFSRFAQLTPGVSIVQGPDGDEITINGQKGIQNNVSIDGADANNPFFRRATRRTASGIYYQFGVCQRISGRTGRCFG